MGQGHTEAWYHLSEQEQKNLTSKAMEAEKRAGSRLVIVCDSRWQMKPSLIGLS
ncbi:MAG: hypothetical protein P4L50_00510 [Anaerolineaceae bacterium]|nr:hypothetical protein [Anaerolineaceae bacterium]